MDINFNFYKEQFKRDTGREADKDLDNFLLYVQLIKTEENTEVLKNLSKGLTHVLTEIVHQNGILIRQIGELNHALTESLEKVNFILNKLMPLISNFDLTKKEDTYKKEHSPITRPHSDTGRETNRVI